MEGAAAAVLAVVAVAAAGGIEEGTGAGNASRSGTDPNPIETPVASTTCARMILPVPQTPTGAAGPVEAWGPGATAAPEGVGGPDTDGAIRAGEAVVAAAGV